jgi:hypothetical protein
MESRVVSPFDALCSGEDEDLLTLILGFLSPRDLIRCSRVCTTWAYHSRKDVLFFRLAKRRWHLSQTKVRRGFGEEGRGVKPDPQRPPFLLTSLPSNAWVRTYSDFHAARRVPGGKWAGSALPIFGSLTHPSSPVWAWVSVVGTENARLPRGQLDLPPKWAGNLDGKAVEDEGAVAADLAAAAAAAAAETGVASGVDSPSSPPAATASLHGHSLADAALCDSCRIATTFAPALRSFAERVAESERRAKQRAEERAAARSGGALAAPPSSSLTSSAADACAPPPPVTPTLSLVVGGGREPALALSPNPTPSSSSSFPPPQPPSSPPSRYIYLKLVVQNVGTVASPPGYVPGPGSPRAPPHPLADLEADRGIAVAAHGIRLVRRDGSACYARIPAAAAAAAAPHASADAGGLLPPHLSRGPVAAVDGVDVSPPADVAVLPPLSFAVLRVAFPVRDRPREAGRAGGRAAGEGRGEVGAVADAADAADADVDADVIFEPDALEECAFLEVPLWEAPARWVRSPGDGEAAGKKAAAGRRGGGSTSPRAGGLSPKAGTGSGSGAAAAAAAAAIVAQGVRGRVELQDIPSPTSSSTSPPRAPRLLGVLRVPFVDESGIWARFRYVAGGLLVRV